MSLLTKLDKAFAVDSTPDGVVANISHMNGWIFGRDFTHELVTEWYDHRCFVAYAGRHEWLSCGEHTFRWDHDGVTEALQDYIFKLGTTQGNYPSWLPSE